MSITPILSATTSSFGMPLTSSFVVPLTSSFVLLTSSSVVPLTSSSVLPPPLRFVRLVLVLVLVLQEPQYVQFHLEVSLSHAIEGASQLREIAKKLFVLVTSDDLQQPPLDLR
jgi:hypothetical protein